MATALAPALLVGCSLHSAEETASVTDAPYRNVRYTVEGRAVELENGVEIDGGGVGSPTREVTKYFGEAFRKDLNGDGREDAAILLTQERLGSTAVFYVAAAIQTDEGYRGSHALPLGDRIIPEGITSGPGRSIVVNWAARDPGEPMTAPPTHAKSVQLELDDNNLEFAEVKDRR